MRRRTQASAVVFAVGIALAMAGCSAPSDEDSGPDPDAVDPAPPSASDCFVGGPWTLDLADYSGQAQSYLTTLGIPVEALTMSGSQTVQFTEDGLMSVVTDVVSTGTIVTPQGPLPFEIPSTDGGSGDWSLGADSLMTIENWAAVPGERADDAAVEVPLPDYSTLSPIGVTCQPGLLTLVGSDAPLVPLFRR